MRFDSIKIMNYRQYQHLYDEFPKTKDTDLHVIVASNGIGKTNLLNAINWCLYGDEPHLVNEKESLPICNNVALEEAKNKNQKYCKVVVRICASTVNERFTFERSVDVTTATHFPGQDIFSAVVSKGSGDSIVHKGIDAKDIVNQYLPRKIRQFFFFDGEQLHNYFGKRKDTSHVKDSIYEIAQVTVVNNAREHLGKIAEEYQKEIAKINPEVEELNAEKSKKDLEKQNLNQEINQLTASIIESENTINTLNQWIAGTEGVVEDDKRYKGNKQLIEQLEEKLRILQEELRALIRKYYILLMLYGVNSATAAYIQEKYDKGILPPAINIDLIKDSLDHHECVICKNAINSAVEKYLMSLLEKYEVSTNVSHKLVEIKNDVIRAKLEAQGYLDEKEKLFDRKYELETKISSLTEENNELYKKISSCTSVEDIGIWMDEREEHINLIKMNSEKKGKYTEQSKALQKEIAEIEARIADAVAATEKCKEIRNWLDFANEARNIVFAIENEIITEVRSQMESETMKIFEELIWKKNTYGHIELDDNFNLQLFHKQTNETCLGSCSAAESELLALAFTIALHVVSGHDCLLFIDTPVGRVSDVNRENFAKSLIEVSMKKQLILAFTPSEYSTEIRNYFSPQVVSSIRKFISVQEEATLQEV